jgi:hypothetical protein
MSRKEKLIGSGIILGLLALPALSINDNVGSVVIVACVALIVAGCFVND